MKVPGLHNRKAKVSHNSRNGLTAWNNQTMSPSKDRCRRPRKGQQVFEFVVAMMLFMGIVLFIMNYLSSMVSTYSAESFSGEMKSKAFQIGEVLVLSKGNWSAAGEPLAVGLAEDWPVLNNSKINWLNNYCSGPANYAKLLRSFWDDPKNITLKIIINETWPGGGVDNILECPKDLSVPKIKRAEAKRHAVIYEGNTFEFEFLTVYVYIW